MKIFKKSYPRCMKFPRCSMTEKKSCIRCKIYSMINKINKFKLLDTNSRIYDESNREYQKYGVILEPINIDITELKSNGEYTPLGFMIEE